MLLCRSREESEQIGELNTEIQELHRRLEFTAQLASSRAVEVLPHSPHASCCLPSPRLSGVFHSVCTPSSGASSCKRDSSFPVLSGPRQACSTRLHEMHHRSRRLLMLLTSSRSVKHSPALSDCSKATDNSSIEKFKVKRFFLRMLW